MIRTRAMDLEDMLVRAVARRLVEDATSDIAARLDDIVVRYVHSPDNIDDVEMRELARAAESTSLTGVGMLYRISRHDPTWQEGQGVTFDDPVSFSEVDLTQTSIGTIGWKSSDQAIVAIERPSRGLRVDYERLPATSKHFPASREREVIVAGRYVVASVEKIPEPFTLPSYGYRVRKYVLRDV